MNKKKNVAVFFGGVSPEHEISIITALQVIENLDQDLYHVIPVYVSKEGEWFSSEILKKVEIYKYLSNISEKAERVELSVMNGKTVLRNSKQSVFSKKFFHIDIALNSFHGGCGEAGDFAGLFEVFAIPFVGTTSVGGVLSMDKVVMKQLFEANNLPITKWVWFYRSEFENEKKKILDKISALKFPLFVKPAVGGSTIGVSKVHNKEELENAIEVASVFDSKIIVEESFENASEINISVLGNHGAGLSVSVCEEVLASSDGVLTYDDKYKSGSKKSSGMASTKRIIPAKIKSSVEKDIQDIAKKAFTILNSNGVARIDFLVNQKTGKMVILEINNPPGSFAFYLWEKSGMTFKTMLTKLIELGIERYNDQKKNIKTFSTNVLENFSTGAKGAKV